MKLPIAPLIELMHAAPYSTLATHSTTAPGYPYATAVPNVLDDQHRPLLLVSALAEHTKNLLADSRVSLSMVEPDATEVQAAARLSLLGNAERFTPSPDLLARYLRYQPEAAQYLQLDFMFFRITPRRIRYIAGVGQMGWFEPADWQALPVLGAADEAALLATTERALLQNTTLLGVDRFGLDCRQHDRRRRFSFAEGAAPLNEMAEQIGRLVELL